MRQPVGAEVRALNLQTGFLEELPYVQVGLVILSMLI